MTFPGPGNLDERIRQEPDASPALLERCPGGIPYHVCWTPYCFVREDGSHCALTGGDP